MIILPQQINGEPLETLPGVRWPVVHCLTWQAQEQQEPDADCPPGPAERPSCKAPPTKKSLPGKAPPAKKFSCKICTATFVGRAEMESHKRAHVGPGAFKCPDCPFTAAVWPEVRVGALLGEGARKRGFRVSPVEAAYLLSDPEEERGEVASRASADPPAPFRATWSSTPACGRTNANTVASLPRTRRICADTR